MFPTPGELRRVYPGVLSGWKPRGTPPSCAADAHLAPRERPSLARLGRFSAPQIPQIELADARGWVSGPRGCRIAPRQTQSAAGAGLKTAPIVPNKGARAGPSARLLRMKEACPSVSSQIIPPDKRAAAPPAWETCPTRPAARGAIAIVARTPPRPSASHRPSTCRQI